MTLCICGHTSKDHSEDGEGRCLYRVTEQSNKQTVIRKKCECQAYQAEPPKVVEFARLTDTQFKEELKKLAERLGAAFGFIHGTFVALAQENRDLTLRVESLEDKLRAYSTRLRLRI